MSMIEILLILSWPILGVAAVASFFYIDNEELKLFSGGIFVGIFAGWILFLVVFSLALTDLFPSFF